MPNSHSPIWTRTTTPCQNSTKHFTTPNSHRPIWTRITKPCQNLTKHNHGDSNILLTHTNVLPPAPLRYLVHVRSSIEFLSPLHSHSVPISIVQYGQEWPNHVTIQWSLLLQNPQPQRPKNFSLLSNERTHRIYLPSASLQFLSSCTLIKKVPITPEFT